MGGAILVPTCSSEQGRRHVWHRTSAWYPVGILTNPYGRMNRPCMREEALESRRARVVMSFVLLMFGAAVGSNCLAQAPAPLRTTSPASTASTTPASSAPASAPAIAVTEIAIEAESALSRVRQLESDSRIDDLADSVATELPRLVKDADSGASEVRGVLSKHPSPDTLRTLDEAWVDLQERASSMARELTQRAAQLDSTLGALARLNETWRQTIESATALSAPEEILRRAKAVVARPSVSAPCVRPPLERGELPHSGWARAERVYAGGPPDHIAPIRLCALALGSQGCGRPQN